MVVLEKRLLGVLSATATLLLTLTLGKAAACTGMPLALAIGCWVGSLRNGRASMVSGLVIGIATALIGPIVLADATAQEMGVQRSFTLTLTCMTFGLPLGALVGTALGALAANLRST